MKKISFLFVGVLALVATSCGFKSEEQPLTDNLVTYTAEGKTKGEVLLGVKAKGKPDKEIILAQNYTTITADNNVINCARPDGASDIYTLTGTPVGDKTYSSFLRVDGDSTVYYTGKAADGMSVFYFPGKDLITCDVSYMSAKHLYTEKNGGLVQVYTLDGENIWSIAAPGVMLLKNESTEEVITAVPTTTGQGKKAVTTAILYGPDGTVLKKLNAFQWKAFQKKLPKATEIGNLKLYELKTLNLKKL